jgi:hypothetical protein
LKDYFYSNHIVDDRLKLIAVSNCFPANSAVATWFSTRKRLQGFSSFIEFESEFKKHFFTAVADYIKLYESYRSFSQCERDFVSAYYTAFRSIADQIDGLAMTISNLIPPRQEAIFFALGLRTQIRTHVSVELSKNPKLSFDECFAIARDYGRAHNLAPRIRPTVPQVPTLNFVQKKPERKPYCNYCKSAGHRFADCPRVAAHKAAGT